MLSETRTAELGNSQRCAEAGASLDPPTPDSDSWVRKNAPHGLTLYRGTRHNPCMIRSFRCSDTQRLYDTGKSRRFSSISRIALRKLDQLENVTLLRSLAVPPGNRLEALSGDRIGQYSIRINDQWRLCFRWTDEGPEDVEIVDYHRG